MSLAYIIAHYYDEYIADLKQYYNIYVGDVGKVYPLEYIATLIQELPRGSRVLAKFNPYAGWDVQTELLSMIECEFRSWINAHSKNPQPADEIQPIKPKGAEEKPKYSLEHRGQTIKPSTTEEFRKAFNYDERAIY